MSAGGWIMGLTTVLTLGVLAFLFGSMARSIRNERTGERGGLWREFGLSLALAILFLVTWLGQGVTEWQTYTDQQREHGEPATVGDFASKFGSSTLENWQSEFLQLFSFVTLAALYVHRGSGESKDGDDRMEASLRRIEERLGTLPTRPPDGDKLPEVE